MKENFWLRGTYLFSPLCPQQVDDGGHGHPTDNGVVNENNPPPPDVFTKGTKLFGDPHFPQSHVGLDKCSSHIAVLAENLPVRNS